MIDLRSIRNFKELTRYLEDELDWPLDEYGFDDLTFSYDPPELGLKEEDAAKVRTIHQLRPFQSNQPWGIFFVEFEKKNLPVVVLRRILRHLVLKKRASANAADAKRWQSRDLLFISAWGEGVNREMTFAHFVDHPGMGLAELRVLGWDDDDTPLHMDYVARRLGEKLRWRDDFAADPESWRKQWSDTFVVRHRHVITKSDELATALAALAKRLRNRIRTILRMEDGFGEIRTLQRAFKAGLIHDLDDDGFADMFAQTVTYGLFSVSVRRTFPGEGTALVKDDVPNLIFTSPFLKEMLGVFLGIKSRKGAIDFDELGISDVTDLLTSPDTHMELVLADFNNKTRGDDPVIHFYEHFLGAYNKKLKIQRGVFYTPQPVVSYIVRSVHELLQTEFGLEHGLADTTTWGEFIQKSKLNNPESEISLPDLSEDPSRPQPLSENEPFVQILDPATGTATFPVEVIDVIHKHLKDLWKARGAAAMPRIPLPENCKLNTENFTAWWNCYVPWALLPRLHAFELMMAPYAIAHMKIGLKLAETGYTFATEERARIYLTNALEPKLTQLPTIGYEALAHEAAAVNEVKWNKRFTVVIGNPPYSNFGMMNKIPSILSLLEDYKRGLNEKKLNLDDDFIKFVRFCQHLLDQTGSGVFGMITNNAFFDGPTHRRMRESLLSSFGTVRAINLHGSLKKGETAPDGGKDENVFDITVGVGISIYAKAARRSGASASDLYGSRDSKYERLTSRTPLESESLSLAAPEFFFVPKDFSSVEEYRSCPSIPEMFPSGISGIKTHRDELLVDYSRERLVERFQEIARNASLKTLKEQFCIEDTAYWALADAKRYIREASVKSKVQRYFYRPFDYRHIFYEPDIIERGDARWSVMQHMLHPNLALICTRQTNPGDFTEILTSNALIDKRALASFAGEARAYPLHIYEEVLSFDIGSASSKTSRPNLSAAFLKSIAGRLQLSQERPHGLPAGLTPEDIFHYAYAVFHSPGYRSRYAEFLKIDFPRLPLTGNLELFRALARLGGELTALHLLEFEVTQALPPVRPKKEAGRNAQITYAPLTEFIGSLKAVIKPGWTDGTVWLDSGGARATTTPGSSGFRGVSEAVWNFHIGGYQVCHKWLKDRKGRTLTEEDIAHYHKIVIALSNTIRLMAEIDQVIETHGGWPGAFQSTDKSEP